MSNARKPKQKAAPEAMDTSTAEAIDKSTAKTNKQKLGRGKPPRPAQKPVDESKSSAANGQIKRKLEDDDNEEELNPKRQKTETQPATPIAPKVDESKSSAANGQIKRKLELEDDDNEEETISKRQKTETQPATPIAPKVDESKAPAANGQIKRKLELEDDDNEEETISKRQKTETQPATPIAPKIEEKKFVIASASIRHFQATVIPVVLKNEKNPNEQIFQPIYRIDLINRDEKKSPAQRCRGRVLLDLDDTMTSTNASEKGQIVILNKDQFVETLLFAQANDFELVCVTSRVFATEMALYDNPAVAQNQIEAINKELKAAALQKQMMNVDQIGIQSIYYVYYLSSQPPMFIEKYTLQELFHSVLCKSIQRPLTPQDIETLKNNFPLIDDRKEDNVDLSIGRGFPAFLMTTENQPGKGNVALYNLRCHLEKVIAYQDKMDQQNKSTSQSQYNPGFAFAAGNNATQQQQQQFSPEQLRSFHGS